MYNVCVSCSHTAADGSMFFLFLLYFSLSDETAAIEAVKSYSKMTGYLGRFGKDSAVEFFKRDDWYHQMFIVHGGNCSIRCTGCDQM